MTKEEFIQSLHHPEYLKNLDVEQMRDLVSQYPYFQTMRMYYQKAMQLQKHPHCDDELNTTALHVASREMLYYLMSEVEAETPEDVHAELQPEPQPEIYQAETPPESQIEPQEEPQTETPHEEPQTDIPQIEPPQEEVVLETPPLEEEELQPPVQVNAENVIEGNLLPEIEIVAYANHKPQLPEEIQHEQSSDLIEFISEAPQAKPVLPAWFLTLEASKQQNKKNTQESQSHFETSDHPTPLNPKTQSANIPPWFLSLEKQGYIPQEEKPFISPKDEEKDTLLDFITDEHFNTDDLVVLSPVFAEDVALQEAPTTEEKQTPFFEVPIMTPWALENEDPSRTFNDWLHQVEDEAPPEVKPFVHQDLIDNFIKEEPRIPPVTAQHNKPITREPQPLVEDEFLTETLAKIYLKQSKYDKAMNIFEKLSLKYPEKSVYFATQLEYVKQLIANKKE